MQVQRLTYLFERYMSGQITPEEQQELDILALHPATREIFLFAMENSWNNWTDKETIAFDKIQQQLKPSPQATIRPLFKKMHYAAAAILILAIGSGIYYFSHQSYKSQKSSQITVQTMAQAIPPGTNKAILILSNGTQKELSLADNGLQLKSDAVLLTTPNGGQYQAVLPDGSKVWLNAASSIKFPSTFSNKERRVEVTGEVYFEVAKDAGKPFKVSGAGQEVEVLGTAFNINVYNDEPNVKTTLIEGSVKVNNKILQPGEAYFNGKIVQANVEQDIAWKNGLFNFNGADLPSVMRQLERWYDIKVQYNNTQSNTIFKGKMYKNVALTDVLEMFKEMGIQFKLEGKTLIIF